MTDNALQRAVNEVVDETYEYVKVHVGEDGKSIEVDIDATLTIEQLEQLVEILKHGT